MSRRDGCAVPNFCLAATTVTAFACSPVTYCSWQVVLKCNTNNARLQLTAHISVCEVFLNSYHTNAPFYSDANRKVASLITIAKNGKNKLQNIHWDMIYTYIWAHILTVPVDAMGLVLHSRVPVGPRPPAAGWWLPAGTGGAARQSSAPAFGGNAASGHWSSSPPARASNPEGRRQNEGAKGDHGELARWNLTLWHRWQALRITM